LELASRNAAICVTELTRMALLQGAARLRSKTEAKNCASHARAWFEQEINLETMQQRFAPAANWLFAMDPDTKLMSSSNASLC
jgi:hypothetical protein